MRSYLGTSNINNIAPWVHGAHTVKYLNNGIESDRAPIKKLIEATGGFKVRKRAWSTIKGFEGIRILNKGQFDFWLRRDEPKLRVQQRSTRPNVSLLYAFNLNHSFCYLRTLQVVWVWRIRSPVNN